MPTDATIRTATLEDASALAGLLSELGYKTSEEQMLMRLSRVIDVNEYATFVAEVGDKVVGILGVRCGFHYARDGKYARIIALIVTSSYQGRGIGRLLVDTAENWAKENGVGRLMANTALHRTSAHRFYEALSFEHTGRRYVKILDAEH